MIEKLESRRMFSAHPVIWIDPHTGDDTNVGTHQFPLKTWRMAEIRKAQERGAIIEVER